MAMVISASKEYEECKGILPSKGSIDKAGKRYKKDVADSGSRYKVNCYRLFRLYGLKQALTEVLGLTSSSINNFIVSARLKRLKSIARKLQRSDSMSLSRMDDIIGIRVICGSFENVLKFSSALEEAPNYKGMRDYIKTPKSTGYRGVHIILHFPQDLSSTTANFTVEVQIRSYYQHIWAICSERHGEQVKEGNGPEDVREFLNCLSHTIKEKEDIAPDTQQINLPEMANGRYLTIVGYQKDSPPIIDRFTNDYERAYNQLLYLEENIRMNPLLLIGRTETLNTTHPMYMGTDLQLESWMPSLPV